MSGPPLDDQWHQRALWMGVQLNCLTSSVDITALAAFGEARTTRAAEASVAAAVLLAERAAGLEILRSRKIGRRLANRPERRLAADKFPVYSGRIRAAHAPASPRRHRHGCRTERPCM